MLQNPKLRTFIVSELLRENQQEGGGKITPLTQIRVKCQPCTMVKHTQTIRRLLPKNCLSVADHSGGGLAFKELIFND